MSNQSNLIRIKRKTILYFAVIVILLIGVTPVLADYLGPNRTVTETNSVCKVVLYECAYVAAKDIWKYKSIDSWACSNESKPWRDYPSSSRTCNDNIHDAGYQYWEREDILQTVTNTYPPATISGSLQSCTLQNGWCTTAPQLSLSAIEPVAGYGIIAIEGSLNGQTFACMNSSCNVPLNQGSNSFAYWALSSFGDSSTMGTLTAKVDSLPPNITGTFTGILGSNGWYRSPVSFNGSASDATSGLASFTCTLDGIASGSCNTISINSEGPHTIVLTARDNAGQIRTLTQSTSIDTQNPTLNASLNGTLGSNNWYTTATLNASASDLSSGSGLSVFEYNFDNTDWVTFPLSGTLDLSDGKHNVDLHAVDKAGNTVSSSKSFWLDTVAPNILLDSAGTIGGNGWYTTNLMITASANDNTSGMDLFDYSLDNSAWNTYTSPLILDSGTHNLSFWAQDGAGLVKQLDFTYLVDTSAPQIAGSLSGVSGMNGWYISELTLSASATDPTPGSGLDTFTYALDGSAETPYIDPVILLDGHHIVQLNAQDKAGLTYSIEQTAQVDTVHPSLEIATALPNWVKDRVSLNGTAGDDGSGLSKVEISADGEQTWQAVTGTDPWSYIWNTPDSPDGIHQIVVRATDFAGLTTQQTLNTGVDNHSPEISLPDSWFQWDTVTLDIWDEHSGLSEARVEVTDPEGRWPKRIIQLDPKKFPLGFKWDRRFGNDIVAEAGTYDVKVIAFDSLGNEADKNASIRILLNILPAGPTATLQPYTRVVATSTPVYAPKPLSSPVVTQTSVVSIFGTLVPTTQVTPTLVFLPTPRPTPMETNVLDWLQSAFAPNPNEASVTEIGSLDEPKESSQPAGPDSNSVLWGTSAAAAIGAAIAYAQEERRKQEEEKSRQTALEAAEEERKEKKQARKMEKIEEERAQEQAWEQARQNARQEELENAYHIQNDIKIARIEAQEETRRIASEIEAKREAQEKKETEELKEGLAAYYNATRQGEKDTSTTESNWWENTKSFLSEKIIQPVNTYVYQPIIKPALDRTAEVVANSTSWVNEKVYQPYVKPAIERTKEFVINESAWINENISQPYVKPAIEKTKEFISNESTWISEKIYQPYIKPATERTKEFVTNESVWINEKIYEPYLKPVVERTQEFANNESAWINENIYQPYLKPVVDKTMEWNTNYEAWVNKNIYQPIFEPVISDINQYIYQPLVDKTTNWWDKYGEWVHNSLDAVGFIPGLGDIADGLNGLIYLGEGHYLEAGISALAMIPLLGDLGKAGKWGLEIGEGILEEAAETVIKEATEELVENVVKETLDEAIEQVAEMTLEEAGEELVNKVIRNSLEEVAEKAAKQTSEEIIEKTTKELLKEVEEKTLKEASKELAGKVSGEIAEKATKEAADEAATKIVKDTAATFTSISTENVSKAIAEEVTEETLEQTSEETAQFIASLREQYGDEMVESFLPFCEKYGINPYDVLTRPPVEGQSLIGWGLGIENSANPANHPLVKLNLTKDELNNILEKSTIRPDSKIVVLGFGKSSTKPYYILSDEINGCHLSLSEAAWSPFDNARANFLVDINIPFVEKGIEDRKIFLFNIKEKVITDPLNIERFSLPELRLIELEKNNYVQVSIKEYMAYIPVEQLDTYEQFLPRSLID